MHRVHTVRDPKRLILGSTGKQLKVYREQHFRALVVEFPTDPHIKKLRLFPGNSRRLKLGDVEVDVKADRYQRRNRPVLDAVIQILFPRDIQITSATPSLDAPTPGTPLQSPSPPRSPDPVPSPKSPEPPSSPKL